ncbi:hypothetical protein CVT24_001185 [Panaeolus cyanescens]|uniref:Uncharacterized protein n=1 Tax=Panaeolus cyanescens TaxID=181874 RepID=A0A409X0M6_9AGAR|nr:hypothetical protein CVT24_001185 [Panaeolus cyanescens]
MAKPLVRPHLHFLPEDAGPRLSEARQAAREGMVANGEPGLFPSVSDIDSIYDPVQDTRSTWNALNTTGNPWREKAGGKRLYLPGLDGDGSDSGHDDEDDDHDSVGSAQSTQSRPPTPTGSTSSRISRGIQRVRQIAVNGVDVIYDHIYRFIHETTDQLRSYFADASKLGTQTQIKKTRTKTGIQDTFQLHLLEDIFASYKNRRTVHTKQEALDAKLASLPQNPAAMMNPVWRISGLDAHADSTQVEKHDNPLMRLFEPKVYIQTVKRRLVTSQRLLLKEIGFAVSDKKDWMCAGVRALNLSHAPGSSVRAYIGIRDKVSPSGMCKRDPQCKTAIAYSSLKSGMHMPHASSPLPSFGRPIIAQVVKILQSVNTTSYAADALLLHHFSPQRFPVSSYDMPDLLPENAWSLLPPNDALCTVNTQHPCMELKCGATGTAPVLIERVTSSLTKKVVEYKEPKDR